MPKPHLAIDQLNLGNHAQNAASNCDKWHVTHGAVRAWLYDRMLMGLTAGWYREVLVRVPDEAALLDIGIGTGSAIARNAKLVRKKRLRILGLDIDRDYLARCGKVLEKAGLSEYVTTRLTSVYDHRGGLYDAGYFSASLMLLPDPVRAIKHISAQLTPAGCIFFTQTFHHGRSFLIERVKPMLHHVTTIHFGRVTYEEDFMQVLEHSGLELVEFTTLGNGMGASYRLAMARPSAGAIA
jgi:SAM-dependent methyltransferase